MGNADNDRIKQGIGQILSDKSNDELIIESLSCIKPSYRRKKYLIPFFLLVIISFTWYFQNNNGIAINFALECINTINGFILPILGIAITGYAIFQALVNGSTLITLIKVSDKEYSKFEEYNYFFLSFALFYLAIIIFNFLISLVFKIVPYGFYLIFLPLEVSNFLFALGFSFYLTVVLHALIELKSFIINLHNIFSTNAAAQGIEYLKKEK